VTEGSAATAEVTRSSDDVAPWDRRQDRRAALLLFLAVLTVYLLTATYTAKQVNDNVAVNLSAWSLGTQGTLSLPDSWEGTNRWIREGRDGQLHTDRFPGAIVWAAPFYAAADLILDQGVPDHPLSMNYAAGGVAAATASALAVLVTFLVLRRLADRRLAAFAALAVAFGTGTWSVSADAMWTHGVTHLTLALGLLAAADGRHVRSGLLFAAAILTRPQTAVVPAVIGVWAGVTSRRLQPVVLIGAGSLLGVMALSYYSYRYFGTYLPVAGYSEGKVAAVATTSFAQFGERFFFTLVHPLRGVLIFAPFLLVLLPFAHYGWRASPWWVRASAVSGVVYLVVQLRSNTWHGGGSYFGSRLTLETLVLCAPLLLRTWQSRIEASERLRGACIGLVVVAVGLHTLGATVLTMHPRAVEAWWDRLVEQCHEDPNIDACSGWIRSTTGL
jgi:hypothetical protein